MINKLNISVFSSQATVMVKLKNPTQNLPIVQFAALKDNSLQVQPVPVDFIESDEISGTYSALEVHTQNLNGFLTIIL